MTLARRGVWACAVVILGAAGGSAWGQFVVDRRVRPPVTPGPAARPYEVSAVDVNARIRDGVAEVRVAQTFHNPGSAVIEAEYMFPLPDEAAVGDLVLMVDGKELPGRVLPKAEARRIYEEIVRSKRDPALLEYMGRGLFQASVFPIPAGADRVVTLRYTQVCRRERDVVEFAFPLALQKQAGQPIGRLNLEVRVEGRDALKSVYCPSQDVRIDRPSEREAKVTLEQRGVIPAADFRLITTLGEGAVGASLLSYRPSDGEDGYFLLLASPRVKAVDSKPLPKTVVFVIDRSGSMSGTKIDQAKAALQFVLDNLRDDDTFNIIAYDDQVEAYKPELQRYSSSTRAEATRFVGNIRPGGGTNIDGGLQAALHQISDDSRPNYVIFLTDGLPTNGELNELKIAANSQRANQGKARIFAFGVGFDVNARLLDRVSGGSGGTSEYVRPDENIEAHVGAFYGKMTRPVLAGISVSLAGLDVNRTYPRSIPDLFEGGQLAWVGRYPKSGPTTIRVTGRVGGEAQSFEFPAELAPAGTYTGRDFVEKLWAVRRVGFIIDQIDLNGPNQELTDELVALSTRYGILTPYTSYLADERVQLHARAENAAATRSRLGALNTTQGQFGVSQRGGKQILNQANSLAEADAKLATADNLDAMEAFDAKPGMAGMGGGMSAGGAPSKAKQSAPAEAAKLAQARGKTGIQYPAASVGAGGFGGSSKGGLAPAAAPAAPAAPPADAAKPAEPAANVRRVGTKTFFRKSGRWVDSVVKPEDDARAIAVEQFGAEYFKLAEKQTAEQNQYFAFDEPVTVRIADTVYRVDPPKTP